MPEQELELATDWGRLAGSLALPQGAGPWPVVLLIPGSGPTDRDGNNPMLPVTIDNLKRLAHALADRGVATLRYDKRGVGASACPGLREEHLRFDDLVDDAALLAGWIAQDGRFEDCVLLGHSEGALIAVLAALELPVRGVVSVAGAGEPASELMRRQVISLLPDDLAAPALATLSALQAQQAVPDVPDELALLFRPSVQPYLMSWFRHHPAQVIQALAAPVLLLQGSADPQVPAAHGQLLARARPDARLRLVEGMDHYLAVDGDLATGVGIVAAEVAQWLHELPLPVLDATA